MLKCILLCPGVEVNIILKKHFISGGGDAFPGFGFIAEEESIELVIPSLMSYMIIRKSSGPNTEPSGTPQRYTGIDLKPPDNHTIVCFCGSH